MNFNYGKSNNFEFDLGLNKSGSKSLNDQKNNTSSSYGYSSYSSAQTKPSGTPSWSHQPNKPTWTHQPAAPTQSGLGLPGSLPGSSSMVGDIFGKSWSSPPASSMNSGVGVGVGVVKNDPHLFGDLLNSAIGQNKGNSNVPLKNAAPTMSKGTFSMGSMADSLPKTGNSMKSGSNWGSGESFGSYTSGFNAGNANLNGNVNKGPSLGGGQPMKSMAGSGGQGVMGSNKDPFGSFVDFKSKPNVSINSGGKGSSKSGDGDDAFGNFQNAPKSSGSTFSSNSFTSGVDNSTGSGARGSYSDINNFGFSSSQPQSQPSVQSTGVGDFDTLFQSTADSSGGTAKGSQVFESQQFSVGDDWGLDSEFGGGHDTGGTTEIEGLPPPPAGVTSATAKNKGVDNYKQGQYADAIKWLSWAVVLLDKAGDDAGSMEVLTCRASCYKEVGEYKKAVADCTKALEQDGTNVAILVQRALLYESMEKYKLGAEDLRTVMKLDPGNRVARSTIHRLIKMAG